MVDVNESEENQRNDQVKSDASEEENETAVSTNEGNALRKTVAF